MDLKVGHVLDDSHLDVDDREGVVGFRFVTVRIAMDLGVGMSTRLPSIPGESLAGEHLVRLVTHAEQRGSVRRSR